MNPIPIHPKADNATGMKYDGNSGHLIDGSGKLIPGSVGGSISPIGKIYPTQTHSTSHHPIDPKTGLPFNTTSGKLIHPHTNKTLNGTAVAHSHATNTKTKTDSTYGLPIDGSTGHPIDPISKVPFDPKSGKLVDPASGKQIPGSRSGIASGISNSKKTVTVDGKKVDPATHLPISKNGGLINPSTGKVIPGSRGPSKQPIIHKEVQGGGTVPPSKSSSAASNAKLSMPSNNIPNIKSSNIKVDPVSHLPYDTTSGRLIDPKIHRPIVGSIAGGLNPIKSTPYQTDQTNGNPIDPSTGLPFNPETGNLQNPQTNTTMQNSVSGSSGYTNSNGIKTDSTFGLPIDPKSGKPIDPVSGIPFDGNSGKLINPTTGESITNSTAGIISGKSGQDPIFINGTKVDPSTNLPISSNNQLIDPKTKKIIPNSVSGTTKPAPKLPVDGGGIIPTKVSKKQAILGKENKLPVNPASINLDPITHLQYSNKTGHLINPLTGKQINGTIAGILHYPENKTPIQTDKITGLPIDSSTGIPFEPNSGNLVDPKTKKTFPGTESGDSKLTKQSNIATDPTLGLPIDKKTGLPKDSVSGLPQEKNGSLVDPSTGKILPGSHSGFNSGKSGIPSTKTDKQTGLPIDPNTGLQFNPKTKELYNNETKKFIPDSHSGTIMPKPGVPQPGPGGILTPDQVQSETKQALPSNSSTVSSSKPSLNAMPDSNTNVWWDSQTGQIYNPETNKTIPGSASPIINQIDGTPTQTDPVTGMPSDPSSGLPFTPGYNTLHDPQNGKPLIGSVAHSGIYTRNKKIATDGVFGLPVDPNSGHPIDPVSQVPFNKQGNLIDPSTGKQIPDSISGILSGKAGQQPTKKDSNGNPIDPSTNLPFNSTSGQLINPSTNTTIPGSTAGVFYPVPGTSAPNHGGIIPASIARSDAQHYMSGINLESGDVKKAPPPSSSKGDITIEAAGGASAAVALAAAGVGAWYARRNRGDSDDVEDDDEYADGFEAEYEDEDREEDDQPRETVVTIDRESSFWNES
ncbi:hypothetical protein ACR3K2_27600 [Cryptosporidium serpentis]